MLCNDCVRAEIRVYIGDIDELKSHNRVVSAPVPAQADGKARYCIVRCRRSRQNVIKPDELESCGSYKSVAEAQAEIAAIAEAEDNVHHISLGVDMSREI